jgi:TatD DNase family protein
MSLFLSGPPPLDCHAHISSDVTAAQVRALDGAHVFAVTRSLAEAEQTLARPRTNLTWGLGLHPGVRAAREAWDPEQFRRLLPHFALVGEVGLDIRAGDMIRQQMILRDVLRLCADEPVLISMHSAGATASVTKVLAEQPHPGVILHWFLGSREEIAVAAEVGAYFSVNGAMPRATLEALPADRVLPETDFPARQTRAKRPADTAAAEQALADAWGIGFDEVRLRCWLNLRELATRAHALDRLPDTLADLLLEL